VRSTREIGKTEKNTARVYLPLRMGINTLVAGEWEVVSRNLATLLFGVHFTDANTGWVAGANNGAGPVILHTTNAGKDWINQAAEMQVFAYLDIDASSDGSAAVAGGFGAFFTFVGSSYTVDRGQIWRKSATELALAMAYQDVQVDSANSRLSYMYGAWTGAAFGSGTGVAISGTYGLSYSHHDWQQATQVRYGHFFNASSGVLVGGQFPSNDTKSVQRVAHNPDGSTTYTLTRHVSYTISEVNGEKKISTHISNHTCPSSQSLAGYRGVIALTNNGGVNWTTVFDQSGKMYFNGVYFVDANNGWVVAEGDGDGEQNAFIFHTSDGGKTWKQQLKTPKGGSLTQIRMLNLREGWAVGGSFALGLTANFWHTTDGGVNWKLEGTMFGFLMFNIHAARDGSLWATALGIEGACSVFRYVA